MDKFLFWAVLVWMIAMLVFVVVALRDAFKSEQGDAEPEKPESDEAGPKNP
jgi:hypothetical protein